MRPRFVSLFAKLALALVSLALLLSLALTALLEASHRAFHLELHQHLFRSLALQLLEENAHDGRRDIERLLGRIRELSIISPGLAAYVVSPTGQILRSSRRTDELRRRSVATEPILRFIGGPARWPVLGDDPLSETRHTIFSAARAGGDGEFLYIVLDSSADGERTPLFPAERPYSMRDALWLMFGHLIAALLAALTAVWFITKPLTQLRQAMVSFSRSASVGRSAAPGTRKLARDEIDQLREIFDGMAATIAAQIDSLRRSDNVRRELFANISHDLRTPLTAVHGYAERLARKPDLAEVERGRYVDIIRRHAAELAILVDQIMELAKLDSAETHPDMKEIRLDEVVREAASELETLADEKGLRIEISADRAEVRGDRTLLRRALHNLLDNAFRESPQGEVITVTVAERHDATVEVAVSDRGPGIAPDELEVIFHRFHRSPGREKQKAGAGLGLAIVSRIAELHSGRVSAENRAGGGAAVRLTLPTVVSPKTGKLIPPGTAVRS